MNIKNHRHALGDAERAPGGGGRPGAGGPRSVGVRQRHGARRPGRVVSDHPQPRGATAHGRGTIVSTHVLAVGRAERKRRDSYRGRRPRPHDRVRCATSPTRTSRPATTRSRSTATASIYRRSDGRNTPGVDVPYAFDGAVTFTVAPGDDVDGAVQPGPRPGQARSAADGSWPASAAGRRHLDAGRRDLLRARPDRPRSQRHRHHRRELRRLGRSGQLGRRRDDQGATFHATGHGAAFRNTGQRLCRSHTHARMNRCVEAWCAGPAFSAGCRSPRRSRSPGARPRRPTPRTSPVLPSSGSRSSCGCRRTS